MEGEIFFINKLTGNKFKKGRLSGPQKKVVMNNKKQDKKSKDKKDKKEKDKMDMKEKDEKDMKEKDKKDMKQGATDSVNTSAATAATSSASTTTTLEAEAESSNVGNNRPKVDQGLLSDGDDEDNSDLEMTNEVTDDDSAVKKDDTDTALDTSVNNDSNEEADSFSVEYVTSILEDKIPKVKVLQCWPQFKICFIQLVSISTRYYLHFNPRLISTMYVYLLLQGSGTQLPGALNNLNVP